MRNFYAQSATSSLIRVSCKVILYPTVKNPAEKITLDEVRKATRAALRCAAQINAKSVAFPGMGTGVGGIRKEDAARVMIEEIKEFKADFKVILIGYDDKLTSEFRKWAQKLNPGAG